jgi:hypothetical protein
VAVTVGFELWGRTNHLDRDVRPEHPGGIRVPEPVRIKPDARLNRQVSGVASGRLRIQGSLSLPTGLTLPG